MPPLNDRQLIIWWGAGGGGCVGGNHPKKEAKLKREWQTELGVLTSWMWNGSNLGQWMSSDGDLEGFRFLFRLHRLVIISLSMLLCDVINASSLTGEPASQTPPLPQDSEQQHPIGAPCLHAPCGWFCGTLPSPFKGHSRTGFLTHHMIDTPIWIKTTETSSKSAEQFKSYAQKCIRSLTAGEQPVTT